ncbi:unnamed protein product [Moneuplotes crassus]|uniref:Uncharacterized protein n=1 Tax=Euplotes crassus TaxID=5936 RepID=A0AAD1UIV0_EUPCR|nr:unnamed protein product [Moneuplotes crassus]
MLKSRLPSAYLQEKSWQEKSEENIKQRKADQNNLSDLLSTQITNNLNLMNSITHLNKSTRNNRLKKIRSNFLKSLKKKATNNLLNFSCEKPRYTKIPPKDVLKMRQTYLMKKTPYTLPIKNGTNFEDLVQNKAFSKILKEKLNLEEEVERIQKKSQKTLGLFPINKAAYERSNDSPDINILEELCEIERMEKEDKSEEFLALKMLTKKSKEFLNYLQTHNLHIKSPLPAPLPFKSPPNLHSHTHSSQNPSKILKFPRFPKLQ